MKKIIYDELKARIETELSSVINKVGFFNNQFEKESIETAFLYPVIFIEFSDISYSNVTQGIQEGDHEITLHCGFHQLIEDMSFLNTTQLVVQKLHGFAGTLWGPLSRVREYQDTNHDNVFVWKIIFKYHMTDENNFVYNDLIDAGAVTLDVNTILDIDDLVIRTGDGV